MTHSDEKWVVYDSTTKKWIKNTTSANTSGLVDAIRVTDIDHGVYFTCESDAIRGTYQIMLYMLHRDRYHVLTYEEAQDLINMQGL